MSRFAKTARAVALLALLTGLVAALAVPASGSGPSASAARKCSVGTSRGIGFSYVTSLHASGTTCSRAKSTVRGYHSCRPRGGRCGHRINGFSCHDRRTANGPASYDANGTCTKRGASISFRYSQFK
jgi:hypothetical protein